MTAELRRTTPDGRSFTAREQFADGVRTPLGRRGVETKTGDPSQTPTAAPSPRLPVAALVDRAPQTTACYAVTAVDSRGRLADRSPLRVLGWPPLSRVSIGTVKGEMIIIRRCDGPDTITGQGHVRLPARIRHLCRLEPGCRVLVAAFPTCDVLAVYTVSALDAMLLAYHEELRVGSRISR